MNLSTPITKQKNLFAPLLVSLGAFLWATDSLFRHQLTLHFPIIAIVTISHLTTLIVTIPLLFQQRTKILNLSSKDWAILLFLSLGSSVTAMIFFTKAFAITSNYNIPILLQKLQPIIAIFLANRLLKETLSAKFLLFSTIAILGAYLISFGDLQAVSLLNETRLQTIIYSIGACTIWGSGTVAAKFFLRKHDFITLTSLRYIIATLTLVILSFYTNQIDIVSSLSISQLKIFFLMAFIPGLFALFIYYRGLQETPASLATICELSFPLGAIFINWFFLNSTLNFLQILGSFLLIGSITVINIYDRRPIN